VTWRDLSDAVNFLTHRRFTDHVTPPDHHPPRTLYLSLSIAGLPDYRGTSLIRNLSLSLSDDVNVLTHRRFTDHVREIERERERERESERARGRERERTIARER